jgi:ribosome biogenesis GTPase
LDLDILGWNDSLASHFADLQRLDIALTPARVVRELRGTYTVLGDFGAPLEQLTAQVAGRMRHQAAARDDFPAVGDWVAVQPRSNEGTATIQAILPRHSAFVRQAVGGITEAQVVAANVDTVFIVAGLDQEFNLRRLERYVTLAWESGADPVLVLNKAALCPALDDVLARTQTIALGVPIHPISAAQGQGLRELGDYLRPGVTVALLGSSGVGKSTLINSLLGEERLRVGAVRADDSQGRHTTTHRELIVLPGGGMIIDNPGMRELQLWADAGSLDQAFGDVEALAARCRFADCRHGSEPGCAVRAALEAGTLDPARWDSYLKLQRELRFLETRQSQRAAIDEKARVKRFNRAIKARKKEVSRH